MTNKASARRTDHVQWAGYWSKAGEFMMSMQENYASRRWDAAALAAIHCMSMTIGARRNRAR